MSFQQYQLLHFYIIPRHKPIDIYSACQLASIEYRFIISLLTYTLEQCSNFLSEYIIDFETHITSRSAADIGSPS